MMGGGMMGSTAIMGVLMMGVFIIVVIAGLTWLMRSEILPRSQSEPLDFRTETRLNTLMRRYAAGQITREEFEAARRHIEPAPEISQPVLLTHGETNLELQRLQQELQRLRNQAAEAERQARLAMPDEVQVRAHLETRQGALFRARAVEEKIDSLQGKNSL